MRKYRFKIGLLFILVSTAIILRNLGILDIFNDIDRFRSFLLNFGGFSYIIYILAYMVSSVLMVPAFIVTITSGIVFGPVLGALVAWVGAVLGSSLAFLTSRYIARDFIYNLFKDNEVFQRIEDGVRENGKDYLIFTRLVPAFPYNVQNYAYGVTNIKFRNYFIISAITMIPMCIMYAYMASEIAVNGVTPRLFLILIVAGILMFLLSQVPKFYNRLKK